jgi:hypothetical protein
MTFSTTRTAALAAAFTMLMLAGCDKPQSHTEPTASAAAAPKSALNPQGVAFAKAAYLDEIINAIQGNDAFMSMEEGLKVSQIDLRVDATAYANDYDANEIAADNKYKGKKILLIGQVTSINKDISGNGYLSLNGPGLFQDVQARLNNTGLQGAADLAKGVTVYLVCDQGMKVATMATAGNCERYSQHLEGLRPQIEKSVTAFLSGDGTLPQSMAKNIAWAYVAASELPSDSPCLKDSSACEKEFAKLSHDQARRQALDEKTNALLKSLKTL